MEDKEVQAKLEQLEKLMNRNEQRMRETFMKTEELLAQREVLISSIDALREFRSNKRRNFFEDNHERRFRHEHNNRHGLPGRPTLLF
jgi:hypothetical protein